MIEQGNELKQDTADMIKEANKLHQDSERKLRTALKQEFKEEIGGLKSLIMEVLNNQNLQ